MTETISIIAMISTVTMTLIIVTMTLMIAFSCLGLVTHTMAIPMTTIRTITDILTTTERPTTTSIGAT